tara:strand:- start:2682 stop:3005 length:324 start_codon:yes stop_codon:yes gene_type:complete
MTWVMRLLPKKFLIIAILIVAVGGALRMQHQRIQSFKANLSATQGELDKEKVKRRAAEDAVSDAVERAERLADARDAAQRRLTDRVVAVDAAQGECLEVELPAGLLD